MLMKTILLHSITVVSDEDVLILELDFAEGSLLQLTKINKAA